MKFKPTFSIYAVVLFVVSGLLYINTINNGYAHDDEILVQNNEFVKKGFGGLAEIFTSDMFASYYKTFDARQQLSGGRYRPLSAATFAVDYALFGDNPAPKHAENVLLFALLTVIIFYCLFKVMKFGLHIAFIVSFLFAIHPVHTEVVANIKSRDEILSLIFFMLAFICFLKNIDTPKPAYLAGAVVSFILALLSKEYAVTLIVLLPLAGILFRKLSVMQAFKKSWWLLLVFAVYVTARIQITGLGSVPQSDPLNNPYVYATGIEKLATQFFVLLKYLQLLFWPYPLSADYGFRQIPYKTFGDVAVLLSVIVHTGLAAWLVYAFIKKQKIAFAVALYLFNLALVSNFIFNIGATMGERLIFHSSLGFCMAIGMGADILRKKISEAQFGLVAGPAGLVLLAACSFVIIPRNADWQTTHTLFIKDVNTVPNSALANSNASVAYINKALLPGNEARRTEYLKLAGAYATKAIKLHPNYVNAYINLGVSYFDLEQYDSAFIAWQKAYQIFPSFLMLRKNAELTYNRGCDFGREKNFEKAVYFLEWSVKLQPDVALYWGDLGGAYCTLGRFADAKTAWEKALQLDAGNQQAAKGLPFATMKVNELLKNK